MKDLNSPFSYIIGDVPRYPFHFCFVGPFLFLGQALLILRFGSTIESMLPHGFESMVVMIGLAILTLPAFGLGWWLYGRTPILTWPGIAICFLLAFCGLVFGGVYASITAMLGYIGTLGALQLISLAIAHETMIRPIAQARTANQAFDSFISFIGCIANKAVGWPMLLSLAIFSNVILLAITVLWVPVSRISKKTDFVGGAK
ncbi:hypothetical protein PWG14_17850 (plasmid) [Chromobacterium amazonense]|uniref:hypothetical protein n=1 Tax=Chromobacterium amazonense TaxID=1382803 RepID=UPI00237E2BD3|nr:hypothetical protein [Chromobacterium amazonense]MDE1714379.1 hypothetical protein [Chromobacterium amazonense]